MSQWSHRLLFQWAGTIKILLMHCNTKWTSSWNVTCSGHDIVENLITWHQTTIAYSLILPRWNYYDRNKLERKSVFLLYRVVETMTTLTEVKLVPLPVQYMEQLAEVEWEMTPCQFQQLHPQGNIIVSFKCYKLYTFHVFKMVLYPKQS